MRNNNQCQGCPYSNNRNGRGGQYSRRGYAQKGAGEKVTDAGIMLAFAIVSGLIMYGMSVYHFGGL